MTVDVATCAAAVTDFKPSKRNKNKLKKDLNNFKLKLRKNKDIIEYLGKITDRIRLVVGFSAETENLHKTHY